MFQPSDRPRLFGVPPGADFCRAFVQGLLALTAGWDPMRLARVTIYVNTRRTGRRMTALLTEEGARLLPRIIPVSELAVTAAAHGLPPPVPALRRRLQLLRLVHALLDRQPHLAPRSAAFDLAEALAGLMDEMADEGVAPEAVIGQDVGDLSEHWQRSAEVLSIVTRFFGPEGEAEPTAAARLARLVGRLEADWLAAPPPDPVIVAGSTGSRGSTHRLIAAVARLPQGAVVLPGFDVDLPAPVWQVLDEGEAEDHPQYRFARLCRTLDIAPADIARWAGTELPRSRLISLALRPAPVSDQWIAEGPALGDLTPATEGLTLIEAPGPRAEALAIALALRRAVDEGRSAAVVTPDRRLTRMVAAELDRWGITPDDSAGEPLAQTAPGRFLRLTAESLAEPPLSDRLLVLLKHPLAHAGAGRGRHLDWARDLELRLRRAANPAPGPDDLLRLAAEDGEGRQDWAAWIAAALYPPPPEAPLPLSDLLRLHLGMAELLCAGPDADAAVPLWTVRGGPEARQVLAGLEREAEAGGPLTAAAYRDLVTALLSRGEVRLDARGHPLVRFWGTIEARVQGADLVILAGLNDGAWPAHPAPDPWMNRRMRRQAGLTSPERRIGLSAHDFQQAVTGGEVILTRSVLDGSAETVPSRWIARLTNLLGGLPGTGVPALEAMKARGRAWLDLAAALDRPAERLEPAARPAPRPPVARRPKRLSVTEFRTLIRDPYAIYARHVLRLQKLEPARPEPDFRLRGTLIHDLVERVLRQAMDGAALTEAGLLDLADAVLERAAPWPGARIIWRARIAGFAPGFVAAEAARRLIARPVLLEERQSLVLPDGFILTGKPDRIDLHDDGTLEVIDYKTGAPPDKKEIAHFDRQLMLLAIMAEQGAFPGLDGRRVGRVTHVALSRRPSDRSTPLEDTAVAEALEQLSALLADFRRRDRGYQARRAQEGSAWDGDYDHLARYGEWSAADWPMAEEVGGSDGGDG